MLNQLGSNDHSSTFLKTCGCEICVSSSEETNQNLGPYIFIFIYRHEVIFHKLHFVRCLKTTRVLNWFIIIGWIKDNIYISIIYHILSKSDFNVCTCSIYILYKMFNTQQHTRWHWTLFHGCTSRQVKTAAQFRSSYNEVSNVIVNVNVNNLGELSRLLRRPVRSMSQQLFCNKLCSM